MITLASVGGLKTSQMFFSMSELYLLFIAFFYFSQLCLLIAFSKFACLSIFLLSILALKARSIRTMYLWDLAIYELTDIADFF